MIQDLTNMVPVEEIPDFWDTLHSSIRAFLSLDYDGTLAPFREQRMEAYPYPGIPELLASIRETTGDMVDVISGRPVVEIIRLMGERDFLIVGSHGYELRYPGGTTVMKNPEPIQLKGLKAAKHMLEKQGNMGGVLEVKVASLAFHTRGLPVVDAERIEDKVHALWLDIANDSSLDVKRFNGGVELISKGWNKGDALRELLDLQPAGTFSVYIGDDVTDEDAFQAIKGRGLGILVGSRFRKSGACTYLKDIKAVKDFLESWLLCVTTRY
jgi:trehalose-phosphatase